MLETEKQKCIKEAKLKVEILLRFKKVNTAWRYIQVDSNSQTHRNSKLNGHFQGPKGQLLFKGTSFQLDRRNSLRIAEQGNSREGNVWVAQSYQSNSF